MMIVKRLFPVILLLLISCSVQEICDDDYQPEVILRLKTVEESIVRDSIVAGVTFYGVREGKPDSLIYDSASLSRVSLPLDPGHSHSAFIMEWNQQKDTIQINHLNESYLISYTCGFSSVFTIENVHFSGNRIVNADIIQAEVISEEETNEEHIWIYF